MGKGLFLFFFEKRQGPSSAGAGSAAMPESMIQGGRPGGARIMDGKGVGKR